MRRIVGHGNVGHFNFDTAIVDEPEAITIVGQIRHHLTQGIVRNMHTAPAVLEPVGDILFEFIKT